MPPLRALLWLAVSTPEQAADEKESLPAQERELTQIARARGWQIIDVLRVPGFSRSYFRLEDFAAEAKKEQIDAGEKLIHYMDYPRFKTPRFDVLVVRDADRFGRTQSLLTLIAETILVGMDKFIYTQNGNQIVDKSNASMFIAMSSFKSSNEIATLVKRRHDGMRGRAMRGIPHSSTPHLAYQYVYDDLHNVTDMIPNEDQRPLFNAIYEQIVNQRVSWYRLEDTLHRLYGYGQPSGKPYNAAKFHRICTSPIFYGHSFINPMRPDRPSVLPRHSLWFMEPGHPIPEGIEVFYNTHESFFQGAQLRRWCTEVKRRQEFVRGKTVADTRYWMARLFVCGRCGLHMGVVPTPYQTYVMCLYSRSHLRRPGEKCDNTRTLREDHARQYITERLELMLQMGIPDAFLPDPSPRHDPTEQIALLEKALAGQQHKLSRLIDRQIEAGEAVYQMYAEKIIQAGTEIERLQHQHAALTQESQSAGEHQGEQGYHEVTALTLDQFWTQPPGKINQVLHMLMGSRGFVVLDGQIVATAERPTHKGRRRNVVS